MARYSSLLAVVVLAASSASSAQSNCPEGFRYTGSLSGTGSSMTKLDRRDTLKLPENAKLDESFQQKKVRATNGKSGARSGLRAQDIPKGVLIIPYGTSDQVYEQGWAVSEPELKALHRDESGKVTQYEFGMRLFCQVGDRGANPQFGDCSVTVEVCYKPLS